MKHGFVLKSDVVSCACMLMYYYHTALGSLGTLWFRAAGMVNSAECVVHNMAEVF